MRIPMTLPERHIVDYEEVVYQLRGYGADHIVDQLRWEKTDSEDGWRLKGPWTPNASGYQRIGISSNKYARLREVCGVATDVLLHRLISAMLQPTPKGGVGDLSGEMTVHHVDEDKLNAAPSNLVIITGGENNNESRPYGIGFCDQQGHPIVGQNVGSNKGCRYCANEGARHRDHKRGRTKQVTPMPPFWTWLLDQYKDAPDPELAMLHDTGVLLPGVTA